MANARYSWHGFAFGKDYFCLDYEELPGRLYETSGEELDKIIILHPYMAFAAIPINFPQATVRCHIDKCFFVSWKYTPYDQPFCL